MQANSFGKAFSFTTFGESHGPAIGAVIDGCPSGVPVTEEMIQLHLNRRKPGQSDITTQRKEEDKVRILSGVYHGLSTGGPIALLIQNKDAKSKDYDTLAHVFRPNHADETYTIKYGNPIKAGGGRASARETAARVAAGAIACSFIADQNIRIAAYVSSVGHLEAEELPTAALLASRYSNTTRCPFPQLAEEMRQLILQVKDEGDTVGGIITCIISGCPPGLGEPIYDKLHADLGKAMLSINAVKGFEYGEGFSASKKRGSQHNDLPDPSSRRTLTNYSGGISGGISNGNQIVMRVAFKPVSTLTIPQPMRSQGGEVVTVQPHGRHDPCVVPRAVPVVEAMANLVIADHLLRFRLSRA